MNPFRFKRLLGTSILIAISLLGCQKIEDNRVYQQISPYPFEETLVYLDVAISEHNYRIIHRSEIGKAIRERGDTNFPLSTITNFCNITYAHEMLQINANLINEMPCTIAVREEQDKVIVSTKLMDTTVNQIAQKQFAEKINQNLISIIRATVE